MTSILRKLAVPCVLSVLPVSQAALVNYVFTGTFTHSDVPSQIAVGDTYTFSFTLDTESRVSLLSSGANGIRADFFGAISNVSFELEGSGSYPDLSGFTTYLKLEQFNGYTDYKIYAGSTYLQFPHLGSQNVTLFEFTLRTPDLFSFWYPPYNVLSDYVPNGFEVDTFMDSPRRLNINTFSNTTVATLSGGAVVPEPASFAAIAGVGAIGFAALRRRRRS